MQPGGCFVVQRSVTLNLERTLPHTAGAVATPLLRFSSPIQHISRITRDSLAASSICVVVGRKHGVAAPRPGHSRQRQHPHRQYDRLGSLGPTGPPAQDGSQAWASKLHTPSFCLGPRVCTTGWCGGEEVLDVHDRDAEHEAQTARTFTPAQHRPSRR
jgi:hypothetical protein